MAVSTHVASLSIPETEDVRPLALKAEGEAVTKFLGKFRYLMRSWQVFKGQKNTSAVMSMNVPAGIGIRADLDDDTVYNITKAFWDNLDQVTSDAPWAKQLDVKFAV